jgi:hypothetical protein
MKMEKKYQFVYNHAKDFLREIINENKELNEEILKKHLENEQMVFTDLRDINQRLVESLSNRNMMASVINIQGKKEKIKLLLYNFEPDKILESYKTSEILLSEFKKHFIIKNFESKRNLWRKFSEGIISGSKFLSSFKSKDNFDNFVKLFSFNKYTKAALPMLLSKEIKGFGFALSCDFLKELGYREYPKPDRHLIKIFYELGLCNSKEPYEVYKAIIEMSENVDDDAYTIDKTFWLISSGKFLNDIKVSRNRDKFIGKMKDLLSKRKDVEEE